MSPHANQGAGRKSLGQGPDIRHWRGSSQGHGGLSCDNGNDLPGWYDAHYLSADAGLQTLAEGLIDCCSGRLCLFGLPGTGKSAFGRWRALAMGMPLLVRKASDLISPYVGETEQSLAGMFG